MGGLEKIIRTGQAPADTSSGQSLSLQQLIPQGLLDCPGVLTAINTVIFLGIYPFEPICTFSIYNTLQQEVPSFIYKLREELLSCVCFEFSDLVDLMPASSGIQTIQLFPICCLPGPNDFVDFSQIFISHFLFSSPEESYSLFSFTM